MHLSEISTVAHSGDVRHDRAGRFWTNLPLRTKGWVVLAIPLVTLCLGALVFYLQDRREQRATTWVRHTDEVKTDLKVDLLLTRAESSVRGFLNNGNPDTLADLQAAQETLPPALDNLTLLVADNETQSDQVATSLYTTGIAGRVRRLAIDTDRLAGGQPIDSVEPAMDEISQLTAQFETASGLLRERELDLARERDLLGALMDNIPYPVFFKDRQSRFIRVNRASARLVGSDDPSRFVVLSDFDFVPPDQAEALFASEQRLMESRQPIVNRIERTTVTGQPARWGLDNKAPIVDRDGKVVRQLGFYGALLNQPPVEVMTTQCRRSRR